MEIFCTEPAEHGQLSSRIEEKPFGAARAIATWVKDVERAKEKVEEREREKRERENRHS